MAQYRVTGELLVSFPYNLVVTADNPTDAEALATNAAKTDLAAVHGLISNHRPENVTVKWEDADDYSRI